MTSAGSLDRLALVEEELPAPGPGDVRVRVEAIGLNFADVFACLGLYSATPPGAFVPGLECAGVLESVPAAGAARGLRVGDRVVLIVAAGTSRMDNKKVKAAFGGKPKMLGLEEVADITGHEVGGVCPFGLKAPLPVYCDVSLKAFDVVVPAAGSTHSAVRITPQRMAELTNAEWVDVCQAPAEAQA